MQTHLGLIWASFGSYDSVMALESTMSVRSVPKFMNWANSGFWHLLYYLDVAQISQDTLNIGYREFKKKKKNFFKMMCNNYYID